MPRSYESQQVCPIARSLDVLGERWTMLIIRDLDRGLARFGSLARSLAGITPRLLSERLKMLEQHEIVERRLYSDHPPRAEYLLTEKGRALKPILEAYAEWGNSYRPSTELQ